LAQRFDIDLGIDPRGVRMPMTEQLPDLAQGSAFAQHLGGQAMAKLVRAFGGRIDPSALQCMPNDRADTSNTDKATRWGASAHKHTSITTMWAPLVQVSSDRFADIGR
jgi:hypothetical protein